MLINLNNDPNYFDNILWTDESNFSTSGIFNRRNRYSWEQKNNRKRKIKQIKKSGRKSINVWCGIFQNKIVGPMFYDYKLTGESYLDTVITEVDELLNQNYTQNQLNSMIWQQDGAPPHNVVAVQEHLNNQFHVWIGNKGTIKWPPNSPDLTPCDSFLWGFLKEKVYFDSNTNINTITAKVRAEIENLNGHNNTISDALENLRRRYYLCIDNNGGHFEHLL